MGHPTALAIQHRDEILTRMASGEPLTSIAKSLGYADHAGIVNRLGDDKDYQEALRVGLIGKLENRERELETADTNVTVTRADRLLGHARWWAERLDPQRFGQLKEAQQQPIQVVVQVFGNNEEKPVVAVQGKDLT